MASRSHRSLNAAGHRVAVVIPLRARLFAEAIGALAKTDRLDARLLALFAASVAPAARPPAPATVEALKSSDEPATSRSDRLLARLHRRKPELLRVLDRPEIPLHTNGSENDIRAFVAKRKISGGTVNEAGKNVRDVLLGLMKTCSKLDISFFRYLGDRLGIPNREPIPPLADLARQAARA